MESIRKHLHKDPKTGRDIVYVVGSSICNGAATISKIETEVTDTDKEITYVYVKNRKNEHCLWKKVIAMWNNVIENEYDWTQIIGND